MEVMCCGIIYQPVARLDCSTNENLAIDLHLAFAVLNNKVDLTATRPILTETKPATYADLLIQARKAEAWGAWDNEKQKCRVHVFVGFRGL
jgi:hypothetical protein